MIKVAFGFLRIPLEFKRHPRTLQYAKCLVHRHNGLHDQPQTARTSLFNRPESTGAVFGRHWWRDMTGQKSGDAAELEDYLELKVVLEFGRIARLLTSHVPPPMPPNSR